jgi:predicted nucleic acid-binding protein
VILLDTSGLLAWLDDRQRFHSQVTAAMEKVEPPYLLSPFVLAELDYLLATRVGQAAQHALLKEVQEGAFQLETFTASDIGRALGVMNRFLSLEVGLADASLVVLAERHRITRILTLDERHFRVLPAYESQTFQLVPSDA